MVVAYKFKRSPVTFNDERLSFYSKGEMIPLVANSLWQLKIGTIELSTTNTKEKKVILGWITPTNFFGNSFNCPLIPSIKATPVTDVSLNSYSLEEINSSPFLAQKIITCNTSLIRQTQGLLAIAGIPRVETRLYHLLALLKNEIGTPTLGGTKLDIRLTHNSIASAIQTTRVTITRLIGKLQKNNCLEYDEFRHIIIKEEFERLISLSDLSLYH